jgi:transcriptional regulator with XRE-family HTH domain
MAASALRHARLDAGLTLFDMQQRAKVLQSRLSLIERGLVEARPDEQERLAEVLQREIGRLFPKSDRIEGPTTGGNDEVSNTASRALLQRHLNNAADALRAALAVVE